MLALPKLQQHWYSLDRILRGKTKFLLIVVAVSLVGLFGKSLSLTPPAHAATCGASTNFITTWKTDNPGTSNSSSITIPVTGPGANYQVDWNNDGVMDQSNVATHDFGTPGTYTIQMCGTIPQIQFNLAGDYEKIIRIDQWGDNPWQSMATAYRGASHLDVTATDTPNLSNVTDMSQMFDGATSLIGTPSFNNWDTSHVTNMGYVFNLAELFNQPIGNWDTADVTNMQNMFFSAKSFNQDLSGWNTGSVTDMSYMFNEATVFNGSIGTWNTSNVTNMQYMFADATSFNKPLADWETANVTSMGSMFIRASAFDQPIGSWNVSNVTDMSFMFAGLGGGIADPFIPSFRLTAIAMSFNQDLSGWNTGNVTNMFAMFTSDPSSSTRPYYEGLGYTIAESDPAIPHPFSHSLASWNVAKVTNMSGMLAHASLSTTAYDATLTSWKSQNLKNNVELGTQGINYCDSQADRQSIITTHSWTIHDNGPKCFYLAPSSSLTAVDTISNNAPPDAFDSTNHTVRLFSGGTPLAEATFVYDSSTDWSGVSGSVDEANFKSVIAGLATAHGITGTHTLYVPKALYHTGVIVCPGATTLIAVTSSCPGSVTLAMGSPTLSVITISGKDYWKITGLTGTGAMGTIVNVPGAPNTGFPRASRFSPVTGSGLFMIIAAILMAVVTIWCKQSKIDNHDKK